MGRSVEEWIGQTADSATPLPVKRRIVKRQGGRCLDCSRRFSPKLPPQFDHRPMLDAPGGENRESKIFARCQECHLARTKLDQGERAHRNRMYDLEYGIPRAPSRNPVPGSKNTQWACKWSREEGRWITRRRD